MAQTLPDLKAEAVKAAEPAHPDPGTAEVPTQARHQIRAAARQIPAAVAVVTPNGTSNHVSAGVDQSFDVFTMGFSNRSWEQTIAILQSLSIERLVDIRTLPGSRRTPQFNLENLQKKLPEAGIEYFHMKSLGGLRKPARNLMLNAAWRNDGFRAYADYMQSPAFEESLEALMRMIKERRTVYTCTEAVFWRCHRQLVSDALSIRGYCIGHILGTDKVQRHQLTPFAKVLGDRITYPALI